MSTETTVVCDGCGTVLSRGENGSKARVIAKAAGARVRLPGGLDSCRDCDVTAAAISSRGPDSGSAGHAGGMTDGAETWWPVAGYERYYEISSWGGARSLPRMVLRQGRPLKLSPNQDGYPAVHLSAEGSHDHRLIHILVAEAFLGPRPPGLVVRHLDGDPTQQSRVEP